MMKNNQSISTSPICVGAGLVALDVVISGFPKTPVQFFAGGSCGNVITILSYLGWATYPVARLSNNTATGILLDDLRNWNVNLDLLDVTDSGSTPIIIHRILRDNSGNAKHKFEFKNPEDGKYLPSYKPCLAKSVDGIFSVINSPSVFFFDRIHKSSIELAKKYKEQGAVIYFEPSAVKDIKEFSKCVEIADVVKFSHDRISDYNKLYPVAKAPLEIQTFGSNGLKFRKRGQEVWYNLPSFLIDNVIDSAGAGDWSTAGIIFTLFNYRNDIENVSVDHIVNALTFGQVLSALNCTFEGARGLMYNISQQELLQYVDYILSLKTIKIPYTRKTLVSHVRSEQPMSISSLF